MKRIPWTQEWNPWAITCTNWASSMAFTPTEAADWHGFVQAKLGAESKSFCGHFGLNRKHQFGPKETRANQWKITSYRYTVILHDGTNHGHTMLYSWDNHQLYCLPMGKIHCWWCSMIFPLKMTPPGLKTCASRPASLGFEAQDGRRITVLTVLQGRFIGDLWRGFRFFEGFT